MLNKSNAQKSTARIKNKADFRMWLLQRAELTVKYDSNALSALVDMIPMLELLQLKTLIEKQPVQSLDQQSVLPTADNPISALTPLVLSASSTLIRTVENCVISLSEFYLGITLNAGSLAHDQLVQLLNSIFPYLCSALLLKEDMPLSPDQVQALSLIGLVQHMPKHSVTALFEFLSSVNPVGIAPIQQAIIDIISPVVVLLSAEEEPINQSPPGNEQSPRSAHPNDDSSMAVLSISFSSPQSNQSQREIASIRDQLNLERIERLKFQDLVSESMASNINLQRQVQMLMRANSETGSTLRRSYDSCKTNDFTII